MKQKYLWLPKFKQILLNENWKYVFRSHSKFVSHGKMLEQVGKQNKKVFSKMY